MAENFSSAIPQDNIIMALLQVQRLRKSFGGLTAVNDVSFEVDEGSITGLIGPNGSGKTVTFNCVTGFHKPDSGRIFFRGREITGLRPDKIAHKRVGRSFQLTGVFPKLSVYENLVLSVQNKKFFKNFGNSFWRRDLGLTKDGANQVEYVMEFTGLREVKDEIVANLPYGQQKILELGSLMVMNPEPILYMFDEPVSGLNQLEISSYLSLIREMRTRGKTFLIIEHNMRMIMEICDWIIVLNYGEKLTEGRPQEVQADQRVVEAYLGQGSTHRSH